MRSFLEGVGVGIRESSGFSRSGSAYDAQHAADSIAELEAQYAAGEIERHAYFEKKRSLVQIYLKATTSPKRTFPEEY